MAHRRGWRDREGRKKADRQSGQGVKGRSRENAERGTGKTP